MIPKKEKNSAADFPPEVQDFPHRLMYVSQLSCMAQGQLFSSAWGENPQASHDYLMQARNQFRLVAALCEHLAIDRKEK